MIKNKYSKKFESTMIKLAPEKTLVELIEVVKKKFNCELSESQLRQYLSKRKIRYKGYNASNVRVMDGRPIGSERIKSDGMVQVKVANDKWEYKQRYIYEQYHKVKLTSKDYIVFMDGDRNNFDIDNLRRVSCRVASVLANLNLPFRNREVMEAAITLAESIVSIKELEHKKPTSHKRKIKEI